MQDLSKAETTELDSVYEKLYKSPRYYSELLLKVKTKDAKIIPLFYNYAQKFAYGMIQRLRLQKKPVRIICVKARQVGISTVVSSVIYHHTATRSNILSKISSHDQDSSDNIYNMYKLFYDKTDEMFRPMLKYSNRKELLFENPDEGSRSKHPGLNSRLTVDTAKNISLGRSFTIQNFHGSEVAYWQNPEEVMMGVEEAVPYTEGTIICLESTANGVGNFFHTKCEAAASGKSDYQLLFVPWFWEPAYRTWERDVKITTLCDHDKAEYGNEKELMKLFKLRHDQLQWRRNKIENNFEGSVDRFSQEYPSTWREAFIFSGQPLFNVKTLLAMKDVVKKPIFQGNILWDKERKFSRKESLYGMLKIWEQPEKDEVYTIGADVSEGVEGGDNSVVEVIKVRDMEQVAEWCGLTQPDDLALIVLYLANIYNKALTGVEVNNHGLTTVVTLQNLRYWNQYRRIVFDKVSKKRKDALGWKTTAVTKPLIVDGLRQRVREGEILLNSKDLIDEMLSFVLLDDGKMGALPGRHDDRVIAAAIAVEMGKQTHVQARVKPKDNLLKSKFTFDFFDKMADDLEREKNRVQPIGSYGR